METEKFEIKSQNGNTLTFAVKFNGITVDRYFIRNNKEYEIDKYPIEIDGKWYYQMTTWGNLNYNKDYNLSENTKNRLPYCKTEMKNAVSKVKPPVEEKTKSNIKDIKMICHSCEHEYFLSETLLNNSTNCPKCGF